MSAKLIEREWEGEEKRWRLATVSSIIIKFRE
jgi:hypothetical protein